MPIDTDAIGRPLGEPSMTLDAGRLKFFAKAIGETNPIFTDEDAAKAAGHPALPAPPTFLFSIEMEQPDPFWWMPGIGIDMRFMLHGEQQFTYHRVAHAGDTLVARPIISDIYTKKGGALEFLVRDTPIFDLDDNLIADLKTVLVVRNPGAGT